MDPQNSVPNGEPVHMPPSDQSVDDSAVLTTGNLAVEDIGSETVPEQKVGVSDLLQKPRARSRRISPLYILLGVVIFAVFAAVAVTLLAVIVHLISQPAKPTTPTAPATPPGTLQLH